MRIWIVKKLMAICNFLLPNQTENIVVDDPANVVFLSTSKDCTALQLREFLLAYESCQVDCIAAVIKYKRTAEQEENGEGSILEFLSDWEDDGASACIGIIKRLLSVTEAEAYGFIEEEKSL